MGSAGCSLHQSMQIHVNNQSINMHIIIASVDELVEGNKKKSN